jgi:LPXTG-site transpeptidase (sortase) family protein
VLNKISSFFLLIAFICTLFLVYELWVRFNPANLSFASVPVSQVLGIASSSAIPVRILLPDLQLDLPVIPAEIRNNRWQSSLVGVSYLTSSGQPGQIGTSIFYGHDFPRLLGNLKSSVPGQKINVTLAGGVTVTYIIDRVITVSPNDISILSPSLKKQLTLYTCTGFLDRARLAVIAYSK